MLDLSGCLASSSVDAPCIMFAKLDGSSSLKIRDKENTFLVYSDTLIQFLKNIYGVTKVKSILTHTHCINQVYISGFTFF